MKRALAAILLICLFAPLSLAEGDDVFELSGYMYGSLSNTAAMIGDMSWDGDWYYANDIVQAYIGDEVTLAGNDSDEIKLIVIGAQSRYALFGLQVGMDESALEPFRARYDHHTFENEGLNDIITLSERDDGYVEILWVVLDGSRITHVIYEVGYGHD